MHNLSSVQEWNICLNLLLDPAVSEIEANGPASFFMKRNGKREKISAISLRTKEDYLRGIKEGLIPQVESIDEYSSDSYLFEGPLRFSFDGMSVRGRCHIVTSPSADYPQITIAKKSRSLSTLDDIAAKGTMSSEMLSFLKAAVKADITIVLSGSTGSGKTTMLEALSKVIRPDQRIGVAEDTPELELYQENVVYLHSVPWKPGMDPNNVATLSWVVAQFQRMRTDKIIVGETRGKEFADFLTASNSGMEGSLTTIHADDPVACLRKMSFFAMAGSPNVPLRSINANIANAVHIIVQLVILPDGKHRVSQIQEITPTLGNDESSTISTSPLYTYNEKDDSFTKVSSMTDNLKLKFLRKGVEPSQAFSSTAGSITPGHGAPKKEGIQPGFTSGLPRINPNQQSEMRNI